MGVGLPREFHSEILGEDFFEIWRSCVFFGGWFDEKKKLRCWILVFVDEILRYQKDLM